MTMRVIITAGAAGIGRAIAEAFLADGARVAVCDIDEQTLADFADAHPNAIAEKMDVARENEVDDFFDHLVKKWGGADVVCANAGIGGPAGPTESIAFADWQKTLAVNLDGAFLTARRAARIFQSQKSGALIFTASTSGLFGHPMRSPYASAKWGVIGLMKTMAMELGPCGVRVNAICPGAVEGERMERILAAEASARKTTTEDMRRVYAKGTSLRRWVTPADVANLAVFLASPSAKNITGQTLAVDGNTESFSP